MSHFQFAGVRKAGLWHKFCRQIHCYDIEPLHGCRGIQTRQLMLSAPSTCHVYMSSPILLANKKRAVRIHINSPKHSVTLSDSRNFLKEFKIDHLQAASENFTLTKRLCPFFQWPRRTQDSIKSSLKSSTSSSQICESEAKICETNTQWDKKCNNPPIWEGTTLIRRKQITRVDAGWRDGSIGSLYKDPPNSGTENDVDGKKTGTTRGTRRHNRRAATKRIWKY